VRNTVLRRIFFSITVLSLIVLLPGAGVAVEGDYLQNLMQQFEYYASGSGNQLSILALIAAATLVSEDLACIAAGLLAAKGLITPFAAVAASALGIYVGDILLYLTGYLVGISALNHVPLKWFITENMVRQCKTLFERRGAIFIFLCRFVPGTRTATFFAAGLVGVHLPRLLIVFALAVILWTPILVLSAMLVGKTVNYYVDIYSSYAIWAFFSLLVFTYAVTRLVIPLFSWRGRRLLVCRWRRLTQWEFWPYYVVNSVTFLYVLYLGAIRYRNPTLFTIVNPAMTPDSGFIGESKADIFEGLPADALGAWQFVGREESLHRKRELLDQFMSEHTLEFPVVLKPDRGQRGIGVGICRNRQEADVWLENSGIDYIMMEFFPGVEFGVFYYRRPHEQNGTLFSINRKKFLSVTGDGQHTLEELILLDERALCMAPAFFKDLRADLLKVIAKDTSVQLGQVGAHSRGTLFLDGADLITPELLGAIEEIALRYDGFYFGRFDVKVRSEEDLRLGRDLKIIELNGVTSEATHIYDPQNSLFYAWKTLMQQWKIAFEIAFVNLQSGHRPMKMKDFIIHWYQMGRR